MMERLPANERPAGQSEALEAKMATPGFEFPGPIMNRHVWKI